MSPKNGSKSSPPKRFPSSPKRKRQLLRVADTGGLGFLQSVGKSDFSPSSPRCMDRGGTSLSTSRTGVSHFLIKHREKMLRSIK